MVIILKINIVFNATFCYVKLVKIKILIVLLVKIIYIYKKMNAWIIVLKNIIKKIIFALSVIKIVFPVINKSV